jgi:hypothetical protein
MKSPIFFLIVFLFLIVGAAVGILFYANYMIYDVRDIPASVLISNHVGFNLTTDMLHFGRLTSPGGSERSIVITNDYSQKLRVQIYSYGDIEDWIYAKEPTFILEPHAQKQVVIGVNVPSDVPEGPYSGTIRLVFTRLLI